MQVCSWAKSRWVPRAQRRAAPATGGDEGPLLPLADVERRHILRVVVASGGNKTLAADTLGITRKTLYRKLQEYGAASGDTDE